MTQSTPISTETTPAPHIAAGSTTILLVDDDTFLLDMYKLKFEKGGYQVKIAVGSDEALKILRDGYSPDILITDVVMPTVDGIDMIGMIRKENLAKNTVMIVLTNQNLSVDMDRAKKVGVDGYIIKAMTIPSEVLDQVSALYKEAKKTKNK